MRPANLNAHVLEFAPRESRVPDTARRPFLLGAEEVAKPAHRRAPFWFTGAVGRSSAESEVPSNALSARMPSET